MKANFVNYNNNNNKNNVTVICYIIILFQHLPVQIQCYKVVAIQGTFAHTTPQDEF